MTTWIKLAVDAVDHEKIENLTDSAFRWLVRAWSHAGRLETDGRLPPAWVKRVPPRIRRELDASKLWQENGIPGGREIHDWLDIQTSRESLDEGRAQTAARQVLHRDPDLRDAIRTRDRDACRYCAATVNWKARRGNLAGTYDHVTPQGGNTLENLVVACCGCNSRKKNRTPHEAQMHLLPPPT